MLRRTIIICALIVLSLPAQAQLENAEQRRAWFYLQHLAGEAKLVDRCILLRTADLGAPKFDATNAWIKYRKITDELTAEIERYVAKYADSHGKGETVRAFTYYVWATTLMAGDDKGKEANSRLCGPILAL